MVEAVALPSHDEVRELFEMLVGVEVAAGEGARVMPSVDSRVALATYTEDDGELVGVLAMPMALSITMGGQLSDLPASQIEELVTSGVLEGTVRENAAEVFNVAASLLNRAGHVHVVFKDLLDWPRPLPPKVVRCLTSAANRLDTKVTIEGIPPSDVSIYLV